MKGGNFGSRSSDTYDGGQCFAKSGNQVAMVVLAATVAVAVANGFTYCQETKLSRREEPEK